MDKFLHNGKTKEIIEQPQDCNCIQGKKNKK